MEVLPVATPPPPRQMSEAELRRLEEQEEDTLRELRLFLRSVADRLTLDKRFKAFAKPVDVQEVWPGGTKGLSPAHTRPALLMDDAFITPCVHTSAFPAVGS